MKKYIVFLCVFMLSATAHAEVTGLEDCDTYLGDTVCFDGEPLTREELQELLAETQPLVLPSPAQRNSAELGSVSATNRMPWDTH